MSFLAAWAVALGMSPIEMILSVVLALLTLFISGDKVVHYKKSASFNGKHLHSECEHYPSVLLIVREAVDIMRKIVQIEFHDRVYEQMNGVEASLLEVESLLNQVLVNELKRLHKGTLLLGKRDKKHYREIVSNISYELKGLIRKWVKENHYIEKTETEFALYIEDKCVKLRLELVRLIGNKYSSEDFIVPRARLKVLNLRKAEDIEKIITKMFYFVREISRQKQIIIEPLSVNLDNITKEGSSI